LEFVVIAEKLNMPWGGGREGKEVNAFIPEIFY